MLCCIRSENKTPYFVLVLLSFTSAEMMTLSLHSFCKPRGRKSIRILTSPPIHSHKMGIWGCFSLEHIIWPISSIALHHNNLWTCKFIIYQVQFGALANFKITNKSHKWCISFANSIHKYLIHHKKSRKKCYNICHSKIKISLLENWQTYRLLINYRHTKQLL